MSSSNNAQGSVVVITGGTSGIGLANARQLIQAGARAVVISGRNQERLDNAVKELDALGRDAIVKGKVANAYDWDAVVDLMQYTNDTFGHIDYVLINAAGPELRTLVLDKIQKPDSSETVQMLDSVYFAIHAASPFLAKSPSKDKAIIITGSDSAFNGFDLVPNYTVAKTALNGITYSYAEHLLALGIRINLVAMGYVLTGMTKFLIESGGLKESDFIPMDVITNAYLRLINDSTKSGVVTRIPHPRSIPYDVQAERDITTQASYWEPILEKFAVAQTTQGQTMRDL